MKYPPMTVTVHRPSEGVCDITVEHDIAQSYSRAVDPRAMREARRVLRGTWALTDTEYGLDRAEPRRTAARFTFISQ